MSHTSHSSKKRPARLGVGSSYRRRHQSRRYAVGSSSRPSRHLLVTSAREQAQARVLEPPPSSLSWAVVALVVLERGRGSSSRPSRHLLVSCEGASAGEGARAPAVVQGSKSGRRDGSRLLVQSTRAEYAQRMTCVSSGTSRRAGWHGGGAEQTM